jgi:hypothetical protein
MVRDDPPGGERAVARLTAAPPPGSWQWLRPILCAVAIGAAGGALADYLTLPLPWMIGAMIVVTAAALAGVEVDLPRRFRNGMVTVLGIMLGSAFTPEIIARMGEWIVTLCALAAWMLLAAGVTLVYFQRFAGYDRPTAFFSATPGGLAEMTLVGGQFGGDERTISLTHTARVLLVVSTIPVWYRLTAHIPPASALMQTGMRDLAAFDLGVLALCAVVGATVAGRLRIPAAFLVGPMVLSAIVHLIGITTSRPPTALVSAAQVVMGTAIGCRFAGVALRIIGRVVVHALVSGVVMLGLTVLFGVTLSAWFNFPLPAVILAFAPGGLAEMSLIAIALGLDAAYIATHHILRIVIIVSAAPLVFRFTRGRPPPAKRD